MKILSVMVIYLEQYNLLLSANSHVEEGQFLHIRHLEYLEEEEQERQLAWLSHDALRWPQSPLMGGINSRENVLHQWRINNITRLKHITWKEKVSSVKGIINEHKNTRK